MANVINLSILNNMPDGTYKTTVSNLTDGEIIHNDDVTFVGGVSQLPADTSALNDLITGIAVSNERPPLSFAPLLGSVVDDGVTPGPGTPISIDGNINIVAISASIMDQSFSDEIQAAQSFYREGGLAVTVYNRAVSGDRIANTLEDLPANLAEFAEQEDNTIFLYHGPGNNVSVSGPYPGGEDEINTGVRQLIADILGAGFYLAMSNITYRVPPGSNPTEPYNTSIIEPIIVELLPDWANNDGTAFIDMYQFYFDNQANIDPDGIHPDATLEKLTTEYFGLKVGEKTEQTNAPVVVMEDVVVQLGNNSVNRLPNWLNSSSKLIENRPSNIGEDNTLFGSISSDATLSSDQGRGNAGDTSESLTNDSLLTGYLYADDDSVKTIDVDFDLTVVDPLSTYTVSATASREATATDRITEVTVGGVTKTIDATAIPAEIISFTGVTAQELFDNGIVWNRQAGSTFSYLSGIRITKE